jgi:hypothetical protein
MDSRFPDGLTSASYNMLPGTTQSASPTTDFSGLGGDLYGASPMQQQLSETGSLHHQPQLLHQNHPQHQGPHHFASMANSQRYVTSPQDIWSASPSAQAEEFDNYSYRASPTCRSIHASYAQSPLSPRTWSPPGQLAYRGGPPRYLPHPQQAYNPLRIYTQEQPNNCHGLSSSCETSFHQSIDPESVNMGYHTESPAMVSDLPEHPAALSIRSTSPGEPPSTISIGPSTVSPYQMEYSGGHAEDDLTSPMSASDADNGVQADGSKAQHEPYAQLIYKALMSRPSHIMKLQEIYQWFEENTDKSEKNPGWKNSIRHNLSMNAVSPNILLSREPSSC